VGRGDEAMWLVAARELVIGATIGVIAAVPLVAAATAGRLVDLVGPSGGARNGPYATMFGVLAAAVFVGIDGHVAVVRAVVDSFASVPALGQVATAQPRVLDAIGALVPAAVTLAVPWLVTAAIVELAIGVGMRLAARAGVHAPSAVAVPAALVMMTATLVATLAVAIAALVRSAI
jgi:flagellar biosynthetic protein FliR